MRNRVSAAGGGLFAIALVLGGCGGVSQGPSAAVPSVTTAPSTGPAVPQVAVPISTASPGTFHNYAITGLSGYRIATGPDRIYFANNSPSGVGWISYQGQFDSSGAFTNDNGAANGITEGADGSMYFTESTGSGLGRLSPNIAGGGTGAITLWNDFGVSSIGTNNVVSDPNGVLWFGLGPVMRPTISVEVA